MKNANKTGSVAKMSGVRRMKWRVLAPAEKVWSETKEDYVYKQKTIGYAKTKAEAYNILYQYTNSPELFIKNDTFCKIFSFYKTEKETTSSDKVKAHLKRTEKFIKPLSNLKLSQISTNNLQDIFNKSQYSKNTLQIIKAYLHEFYKYAILNKQADINLMEYIKIKDKLQIPKGKIFTEEEIQKIWEQPQDNIRDILLIYLYTGMRKSELLELRKENIYIDEDYMIGGIKTKAGKDRVIPIHRKIKPLIEKFYNNCCFCLIEESNFEYSFNYFYKRTKIYYKQIGIADHTIHDTRKTFITRLNDAGANITDIAKIVGHSTGVITLDIYTIKDRRKLIETVNLLP